MTLEGGRGSPIQIIEAMRIREEFEVHRRQWIADVRVNGEPNFGHPDYESIIQLGSEVIPQLLVEFDRSPALWIDALVNATGENPAADEINPATGTIEQLSDDKARDRWTRWGLNNGYLTEIPPNGQI